MQTQYRPSHRPPRTTPQNPENTGETVVGANQCGTVRTGVVIPIVIQRRGVYHTLAGRQPLGAA